MPRSFALPDLPIVEILDGLRDALRGPGRVVVAAPPGAGKTTVVPLAVLDEPWLGDRRVGMLEPRRLATRAAARRMAAITGTEVGGLVGYQTRDERRIGPSTRVEVLTEGVLTRRLQQDPELPGVGMVIFDEVHERNLTTDLGLAFTLDAAATLRPDLRLAAMSATADTALFARLLGSDGAPAPIVESAGRMHPVDVRWVPRSRDERLEPAMASAIRRALRDEPGDVLAFLPGIGEISRLADDLVGALGADVDVHRLAGALALEEQDRALAPSPPGRRRVVLATDIAETSLTVDGVRVVVDSGLARAPRFDPGTGMTRLTTVSISRDSAEQRAGRAGRVEPGAAYRLWSRMEHGTRPAHRPAEITQVDLAGFVLELAAWGTPAEGLSFVDAPPSKARRQAVQLLSDLGAIDATGAITPAGRAMVALPVHPRLARMVVARPDALSCAEAAVVEERDVLRGRTDRLPADLALRVAVVCGQVRDDRADRRAADRVRERAADIARRAGIRFDADRIDPDAAGVALLAGFPDRLAARRRPAQFQLRNGTGAWVADDDPLAAAPFLVAADLDGKRTNARIRLGAAVDASEIGVDRAGVEAHTGAAGDVGGPLADPVDGPPVGTVVTHAAHDGDAQGEV
ncbi:MAG TPA: ATP-dependent helicase HrpB, partial [Ilumatobacteraceae bacterium]|nr:ATP-dependent helicase HrpB [Ilumatobacteraceae bacterium]